MAMTVKGWDVKPSKCGAGMTANFNPFQTHEVCRHCGGALVPKDSSTYSTYPVPYYCIKCGKDHETSFTIEI